MLAFIGILDGAFNALYNRRFVCDILSLMSENGILLSLPGSDELISSRNPICMFNTCISAFLWD